MWPNTFYKQVQWNPINIQTQCTMLRPYLVAHNSLKPRNGSCQIEFGLKIESSPILSFNIDGNHLLVNGHQQAKWLRYHEVVATPYVEAITQLRNRALLIAGNPFFRFDFKILLWRKSLLPYQNVCYVILWKITSSACGWSLHSTRFTSNTQLDNNNSWLMTAVKSGLDK